MHPQPPLAQRGGESTVYKVDCVDCRRESRRWTGGLSDSPPKNLGGSLQVDCRLSTEILIPPGVAGEHFCSPATQTGLLSRLPPPLLGPSSPPIRRRSGWLGVPFRPARPSPPSRPIPPIPSTSPPPKPPPCPSTAPKITARAPQFTTPVYVRPVWVLPSETHRSIPSHPYSTPKQPPAPPFTPLSPPQHPLPSALCAQGHSFPILSFRAHPPFITCMHTPHSIYILPES